MWPVLAFSCSNIQYTEWNIHCLWNKGQLLYLWPVLAFLCSNTQHIPWNLHCPWNKVQHLCSVTCSCFHMLQYTKHPIKYAYTLVVVCFCHCYIITKVMKKLKSPNKVQTINWSPDQKYFNPEGWFLTSIWDWNYRKSRCQVPRQHCCWFAWCKVGFVRWFTEITFWKIAFWNVLGQSMLSNGSALYKWILKFNHSSVLAGHQRLIAC